MKKLLKFLSGGMAALMMLGMLFGCGTNSAVSSGSQSEKSETAETNASAVETVESTETVESETEAAADSTTTVPKYLRLRILRRFPMQFRWPLISIMSIPTRR